jgi:hypothetical protein
MIKKIISGGQTGADQAALDTAIEMGIPHGGWVPRGRRTENGRLSEKYRMQETNTIDYAQRTELNVADSDGTLLFSHGELKGGSELTKKLARKHVKPCLHVDLNVLSEYKAVEIINSWIDVRNLEILNVAGSRASEDPLIYDIVRSILKSVFYPPPESIAKKYPSSVAEAVEKLISEMPLKEKATIARLKENDLLFPPSRLWRHIRDRLGLSSGNDSLLQSCCFIAKKYDINADEASSVIIRELWKKLCETHGLRIVK